MDLIDEFIRHYRREIDFYHEVARLTGQQLEAQLQASGIRAIVTYRAKRPDRLEVKLRKRLPDKNYQNLDEIYDDIVDLAGVRVALYFPRDRDEVGKLIQTLFELVGDPKQFPEPSPPRLGKRFSGYWATHYRVRHREDLLQETQKRYTYATVEIQVASVLMHAWAEVEHDLAYKPLQGALSYDELAILDELNGLVLAGELALERLQRAVEARVSKGGTAFGNHYELAAFLFDAVNNFQQAISAEPAIGRVDILFELLKLADLNDPVKLAPYVNALDPDTERRPVAEQVIDQILTADPSRYELYRQIRADRATWSPFGLGVESARSSEVHAAIGYFMTQWILLERVLSELTRQIQPDLQQDNRVIVPPFRVLARMNLFDADTRGEIERLRRVRNNLVHGIEIPDIDYIREAAAHIGRILGSLESEDNESMRNAVQNARAALQS